MLFSKSLVSSDIYESYRDKGSRIVNTTRGTVGKTEVIFLGGRYNRLSGSKQVKARKNAVR